MNSESLFIHMASALNDKARKNGTLKGGAYILEARGMRVTSEEVGQAGDLSATLGSTTLKVMQWDGGTHGPHHGRLALPESDPGVALIVAAAHVLAWGEPLEIRDRMLHPPIKTVLAKDLRKGMLVAGMGSTFSYGMRSPPVYQVISRVAAEQTWEYRGPHSVVILSAPGLKGTMMPVRCSNDEMWGVYEKVKAE